MTEKQTAYIGIGSNLGDRMATCLKSIERMEAMPGSRVTARSSLYETEPHTLHGEPAPWFVNAAVRLETALEPTALHHELRAIESEFGRIHRASWDPRTLDLDLLFYDDLVVQAGDFVIPHPQIPHRRFVLVPLAEIAPQLRHPVLGKTIATLLQETVDTAAVRCCQKEKGGLDETAT